MSYLTYDEMTDEQRRAIVEQTCTVAASGGIAEWTALLAVRRPPRYEVEHRCPRPGERYFAYITGVSSVNAQEILTCPDGGSGGVGKRAVIVREIP